MWEESADSAITTRSLVGEIGTGISATLDACIKLRERCMLKGLDFDGRLDKKKRLHKMKSLHKLLEKEKIVHDKLIVLGAGNPLENFAELVDWTRQADDLNMSKYFGLRNIG